MTRDDIIRMAREAGFAHSWSEAAGESLERFATSVANLVATLVTASEREAIAKMFDGEVWAYDYREIAAAIRARGEK
jgi:hypothetical protein